MTIAGKGGRPRKWRSDADRARAYRARKRGEPEPPQVVDVVDESDELAAAWRHVDELGRLVREVRDRERALHATVRQLTGELEVERLRRGRAEVAIAELRRVLGIAREANDFQRRRIVELTAADELSRQLVDAIGTTTD